MTNNEFPQIVKTIVDAMDDRKAIDIKVLDLRDLDNAITDFFIICEGTSNTQVKAIGDNVEKRLREELNEKAWHIEGTDNSQWVLMDYVNTVVHIFQKEYREFYDLESLWGDAKTSAIATN